MKNIYTLCLLTFWSYLVQAQITQDWNVTNGTTSNDAIDFATCSASDNAGNTYLCGFSARNEANAGQYLFLRKVSGQGQLVWDLDFEVTQLFSGDTYARIALDNEQNIILAATENATSTLFIAKISPAGTELWSDLLPPNSANRVTKVITDNENNIYVGASNGDFVLVKYNEAGALQYNLNIEGGLGIEDRLVNLSLDNNNNIIISGNRGQIPGDNSAIVFKYTSNGNQLWNTVIAHPNTSQIELKDHVILNNEVVVAGYFFNTNDLYRGYLTKISASGTQSPLSVDPQISSAYFFVSTLGSDLVVGVGDPQALGSVSTSIKRFTSTLAEVWNQNLPSGGTMHQLFTHQNTDIYAFVEHGISSNIKNTVYKLASNGNVAWGLENDSSTYLGSSTFVTIGSTGNVRLASPYFHGNNAPYNNYTDIKVFEINAANGDVNWTFQYDGETLNEDRATLLAKDSQGNVYCAGTFSAGYTNNAVGITKYDSDGNLIWLRKFDFSAGNTKHDEPLSIVCDAQDNLIVGGFSTNSTKDFLLIKVNPSGEILWEKIFNGSGNNSDQFNSVITDSESNIYAAGLSLRNFGGNNIFYVHQVYKYDSDGNELWENWDYSNPTGTQKLVLSPSQSMVYVGCEYYGSTTNPSDLGVFKLRADNGSYLHWANFSGTSNNSNDRIRGIVVDSLENIYLNGNVNNAGLKTTLIKFDSTLTQTWAEVYPQNSIGNTFYQDWDQNMLVTMSSMSADSFAVIKYDQDGEIIWAKKLISNQSNITNTQLRQFNDTCYAVVATLNVDNIFLKKVFVLSTEGLILDEFTTANAESYNLRDILAIGNAIYACGFYADFYNESVFHENYFLSKFSINLNGIGNQAPTITAFQNTTACANSASLMIPFTISDENLGLVSVTAGSTNESVIANSAISISGSGAQQMLTISLSGAAQGQTTIEVSAQDAGGLTAVASFVLQVEVCTGINGNADAVLVYPNPARDAAFVQFETGNAHTIQVFSFNGQLMQQLRTTDQTQKLDLSALPNGIYRLVIINEGNSESLHKNIEVFH